MAIKCYILGEGAEGVKVIRVISKEEVGSGIRAAINRITSLEKRLSVATGGCVFVNYVIGPTPPYLKYSEFRPDIYHTADCREIFWQGEETKRLKHHPAPLNDMWGRGYSTIEQYRCGIDLVTRYPVTLSVLQYLTGNENADYELELFKLFLTQNSGDMNELESSFGFLESMISASCVDKSNLIYMIKEMYPDLYHFVTDVMPFVVVDEKSFDDGVFSVSYDTARKNACGLKLIRQLHKTVNGSNNSI